VFVEEVEEVSLEDADLLVFGDSEPSPFGVDGQQPATQAGAIPWLQGLHELGVDLAFCL
jgi:hypothetical protein